MKANHIGTNLLRIILFIVFAIGTIACITLIAGENLTNRESALLTLLATILSVLASWIITHIYSESQYKSAIEEVQEQHRTNLRTYALKAAEKVNNLSNELNKLSLYLEEELNYTDYHSTEEELLAKEERIESVVHIIRTLKSVNDTSLSDWEGVIGDELDQQREEREEKEEELKSVIDRVETLVEDQRQGFEGTQRNTEFLRAEIDDLKKGLRTAVFQLTGTTLPKRIGTKGRKQTIQLKCPTCLSDIEYHQKSSLKSIKTLNCKCCNQKLISRYTEDKGFILIRREIENIPIQCPHCGKANNIPLDTFPSTVVSTICSDCKKGIQIIRTMDSVEVKSVLSSNPVPKEIEISDEIIDKVKEKMPPQPWPRGAHKKVATELGLSENTVYRAITELIKRRVFHIQLDGILYEPLSQSQENKS